jgi:hypothetical protein
VFYLDVAYVSHTCCKCMFQMFHLLQIYVAFKYFMLQVFYVLEAYSESHGGTARAPSEGARQAGGWRMGRAARLGSCMRAGACSCSSWLPGPVCAEMDGGRVHVHGGMRQTWKDCSDAVGVRRVSTGPFSTVQWNPISSDVRTPVIPLIL